MNDDDRQRLVRIESLLEEIVRDKRASKRRATRRRGTVAERAAARVQALGPAHQPTEMQRARMRRKLLAG